MSCSWGGYTSETASREVRGRAGNSRLSAASSDEGRAGACKGAGAGSSPKACSKKREEHSCPPVRHGPTVPWPGRPATSSEDPGPCTPLNPGASAIM